MDLQPKFFIFAYDIYDGNGKQNMLDAKKEAINNYNQVYGTNYIDADCNANGYAYMGMVSSATLSNFR